MKTRYKFLLLLVLFSMLEGIVFGQKAEKEDLQRRISIVTVIFDEPVRVVGLAPQDKWEEITDTHMSFRFTQDKPEPYQIMVQVIRDCTWHVLYVYPEFYCRHREYVFFNKYTTEMDWLVDIPPVKQNTGW